MKTKSKQKIDKAKLHRQVSQKGSKGLGVKSYIEDTSAEIKKVTWPGNDLVIRASFFILVIVISTTLYVTVLDYGFSKLFFDYVEKFKQFIS